MSINNPIVWSLTDGSQGMISQANGLGLEFNDKIIEVKTDLIFPWNKMQPGFLPIFNWIFKNKIPSNNMPNIIISCGRKSVYLSIFLKRKFSNCINIHIQNPKVSSKHFNFIVAPNHDNFKGQNVLNSVGAVHYFKDKINSDNKVSTKQENLVSCIIGGENNHYFFTDKEANDLCNKIIALKQENPELKFLIISSRRTSDTVKLLLNNKLSSIAKLWLGKGNNPYEFAIYNSKYFIITSDSTSMISEAAISGNPIYVYKLPFKRRSKRFDRFHQEFKDLNITRDLISSKMLENWSYEKLNESKRIAGIIKERIIQGIDET